MSDKAEAFRFDCPDCENKVLALVDKSKPVMKTAFYCPKCDCCYAICIEQRTGKMEVNRLYAQRDASK